jgi:hypothetical protein
MVYTEGYLKDKLVKELDAVHVVSICQNFFSDYRCRVVNKLIIE